MGNTLPVGRIFTVGLQCRTALGAIFGTNPLGLNWVISRMPAGIRNAVLEAAEQSWGSAGGGAATCGDADAAAPPATVPAAPSATTAPAMASLTALARNNVDIGTLPSLGGRLVRCPRPMRATGGLAGRL